MNLKERSSKSWTEIQILIYFVKFSKHDKNKLEINWSHLKNEIRINIKFLQFHHLSRIAVT